MLEPGCRDDWLMAGLPAIRSNHRAYAQVVGGERVADAKVDSAQAVTGEVLVCVA
jgi:hypothetical protein